jgi:L-glutamine:scyllo-inosose aminotransferase/L-glutamine:2-deoxy-scyllo-inosose/3-amino-2,3-dideoxy-scyllo-inosose aminotransferase
MGLTISLLALGISYGDEVIVPGQTWVACASAVAAVGAVPVLADVDIETLCISPDQISKLISPKTKAIIVVHAFCKIAPISDIVHIATQNALKVIEDCSQAHGAELNGRKVGTFGDVGVFSFQQSKVLTSGEGGAVITDNEETSVMLEQLRADGRIFTSQSKLNHLELEERGQVLGQNFCLSEFQSAILSDRLTHLDRENAKRRANARHLSKLLDGIEGVHSTTVQAGELETYYNYVFRFSDDVLNDVTSNQLAAAISEEINIQVAPAYIPMNRHRLYAPRNSNRVRTEDIQIGLWSKDKFSLPNAEYLHKSTVTMPHPPLLSESTETEQIAMAIEKVISQAHELKSYEIDNTSRAF